MTAEEAVRQRILDLSTSAATRVYMLKVPHGLTTWPAVRVQNITDLRRDRHLRGGSGHGVARVQVDCCAPESSGGDPWTTVAELADEIHGDDAGSGLSAWRGSYGSPEFEVTGINFLSRHDGYEFGMGVGQNSGGELRTVRMILEYEVFYTKH
jgi:hypothetical protein